MSVSHVIFDLDGTLVDSESLLYSAIDCLNETFGFNSNTLEVKSKLLGYPFGERSQQLYSDLGFNSNLLSFNSFKSLLIENCLKNVEKNGMNLMPGVVELVTHLSHKKIPMGIASGTDPHSFNGTKLRFGNFFQNFSVVVLSGDESLDIKPKPDPDIYLEAFKRFSPMPESVDKVLVFEDSLVGVRSALNAGMKCVFVLDSRLQSKPKSDLKNCLLINSLLEFNPQIFGLE